MWCLHATSAALLFWASYRGPGMLLEEGGCCGHYVCTCLHMSGLLYVPINKSSRANKSGFHLVDQVWHLLTVRCCQVCCMGS